MKPIKIFSAILFCLMLLGAAVFLLNQTLRRGTFKNELESACSDFLHRPLTIERLSLKLPQFVLVGRNVVLKDNDQAIMIECARVALRISPRSLLHRKVIIEKITFFDPLFNVQTTEKKSLNFQAMISDIQRSPVVSSRKIFDLQFKRFVIENGRVNFLGDKKMSVGFEGTLTAALDPVSVSTRPFAGEAHLKTLRFEQEEFRNVSSRFYYQAEAFSIDDIIATGLGGTVEGEVKMEPSHVTTQMKATDVELKDLFQLFGSSMDVSGRCQLDGHLTTGWGGRFLPQAEGELNVKMEKGHLPEAPVILRTLTAANVWSLVNYLKGKKNEEGLPIAHAEGKIKIEKGQAIADDPFFLENDLLQFGFRGSVNLTEESVDGHVVIHVLTLPDEIIGMVPGLKWILMGKNRSFFPIYVRIKGPLNDPKVKTQPLKSLTGPIWQTLGRIFHLPKDLVDKFK